MREDEGRGRDKRAHGTKADAPVKKKKRTLDDPSGNKRGGRNAVPGPVETTIKLGRSLRTGGAYIVKVSRKAYKGFNTFTQGEEVKVPRRDARASRPAISRNLAYLIFLVSIFVITSVALMVLNNSSVTVERQKVTVVGLPRELEGYNILVVSDLHGRSFGTRQTSLLRTINGLSYNLALFAGDMVGRSGDPQPFYDLLEGLTAKRPTYFIAGDSDPAPLLDAPRDVTGALEQFVLSDWVLGARQRGATYLSAPEGITVGASGNVKLWISPASQMSVNIPQTVQSLKDQLEQETSGVVMGLDGDRARLPFTDWRYRQMLKLDKAAREMASTDTHIALAHYPPSREYIEVTQQLGEEAEQAFTYLPAIDLAVAGHYCGGGWNLPFIGALYVPNTLLPRHGWFPDQRDVSGLRALGSTQLYTSPGLSVTDKLVLPNFRLFNPPIVTVLTLSAEIPSDMRDE